MFGLSALAAINIVGVLISPNKNARPLDRTRELSLSIIRLIKC
jgi:hypothetical protein